MSSSDEEIELLATAYLLVKKKRKRQRSRYMRPILERRPNQSTYVHLVQEMRAEDPREHRSCFRMDYGVYKLLLAKVGPKLVHAGTHRYPISPDERLSLTLE